MTTMTTETKDQPTPWAILETLPAETLARDLWTERQRAERLQRDLTDAERRATVATLALGERAVADALAQGVVGQATDAMSAMAKDLAEAKRDLAAERLRLTVERQEHREAIRAMTPRVEVAVASAPEDPAWAAYRRGEITAAPLTPEGA